MVKRYYIEVTLSTGEEFRWSSDLSMKELLADLTADPDLNPPTYYNRNFIQADVGYEIYHINVNHIVSYQQTEDPEWQST